MKAFGLLLFAVAFLASNHKAAAQQDFTKLCEMFAEGTKIQMPGTCDKYITCLDGGIGEVHTCPVAYDVKTQSCVATLASSSSTSVCGNRCDKINGKWVADPLNCHAFFWCDNGVAKPGLCPDSVYHFDESQQMCVFNGESGCIGVSNICELVPDGTQFKDEKDCSYYYTCSKGAKSRKACASNKYFDVSRQICDNKYSIDCTAHPKPACGTAKKPYKGFKSDGATCRGYFYCADKGVVQDTDPKWRQCPEGKFFSEPAQACVNPLDSPCAHNRCETRGNLRVSSVNNNCRNYLLCENGKIVGEQTCLWDYFFDELKQTCVPYIIDYECCDIKK